MSLDEAIERLEIVVAEVKQASLTDEKTKLGSALALHQEARLINEGASKFNVIVFGDLNEFKKINDDHTHAAGDVAIRRVGETIHKIIVIGLQAKAFRQGGDEFVILLKRSVVKKFLSAISNFSNILFSYNNKKLKTAMSFGYVHSDGKTSFSDLLERAEMACQNAKVLGNGTCLMWSEDIKLNPLVRISKRCQKCDAKISCTVPKQSAPMKLKCCPCCGTSL